MNVSVTRIYNISCGHHLPALPEGHKCRRLHGHNYRVEITITGEVGETGMLVESSALDTIIKPVLQRLDHQTLNDLGEKLTTRIWGSALVANPTVENLALYLWDALRLLAYAKSGKEDARLSHRVKVWETDGLCAEVSSPIASPENSI